MESILLSSVSRGPMEQTGVTHAYKYSRSKYCAFGSFNFHQDVPQQVFSCSNGKNGSSHILSKNGTTSQELTNLAKEI